MDGPTHTSGHTAKYTYMICYVYIYGVAFGLHLPFPFLVSLSLFLKLWTRNQLTGDKSI
ncbi:hypothetical protein CsatB_007573 [Cannabis sativa]